MTDHKFTDEEVIKALECCLLSNSCASHCPYDDGKDDCIECTSMLANDALDLIKRQKAEIERLKKSNDVLREDNSILATEYAKKVRAEAIKEFAERLKHIIGFDDLVPTDCVMLFPYIDNLAEEMTEGKQ